ncbi:uncharacterized protein VDAG_04578 [Verticillium dahliae VdLs.17]|uniref:Uncharacterized protein n=1 Tax=Verticillium dahliae (strain VdLs.17 / ATCC MYA-4575 / FGSC 10137) TaxID=498257 RepID=G2X3J1_VERDV|nr:uncharacterized protein VDAG_04578 [Verticillium dahliae VdLs.17]EGY23140.1 hypothetical protein VDAG_04578 [Verticillium dahliae VdLs.17]
MGQHSTPPTRGPGFMITPSSIEFSVGGISTLHADAFYPTRLPDPVNCEKAP